MSLASHIIIELTKGQINYQLINHNNSQASQIIITSNIEVVTNQLVKEITQSKD